jgi:hypothetical protein
MQGILAEPGRFEHHKREMLEIQRCVTEQHGD